MSDEDFAARRRAMVDEQIAGRGIRDPAVLEAMRSVPREDFVAADLRDRAYDDTPLPIEQRQTISQPYIVALMLEAAALRPGDCVLDIGAGSGYACAVASLIARHVDAVERHAGLADSARERLTRLGYVNVAVHCADGSGGWPQGAPYDAILVAAGGPRVPAALREQLAPGGRIVMPVGARSYDQHLVRVTRLGENDFRETDLGGVAFVPLIGAHGWAADSE
ncbi:MAG TPA: protein-L-isoaspartate(D-aspartate) O-methyltransferase [Caldimonas sp.]|nr:protein-L-isoaspartate(D-aspartate) O-methyltransferase [Caldimonas sp.]